MVFTQASFMTDGTAYLNIPIGTGFVVDLFTPLWLKHMKGRGS